MNQMNTSSSVSKEVIGNAMTFPEYFRFTEQLAERKITGHLYTEDQLEFTKLNFFRMKRILRNMCIPEKYGNQLRNIDDDWYWLVLAEPWCGDAANHLPVIALLASLNIRIELRILLRDQHPDVMDQYLTNGTRSIPKLICYDKNISELGNWGPRPQQLIDHIHELKETSSLSKDELKRQIQIWYNVDGGNAFLKEFDTQLLQWQRYRKAS